MKKIADILSHSYSLRTALDMLRVLTDELVDLLVEECRGRNDDEAVRLIAEARGRLFPTVLRVAVQPDSELEMVALALMSAKYIRTFQDVSWNLDSPEWNALNRLLLEESGEGGLDALDLLEWAFSLRSISQSVPAQDPISAIGG